MSSEREKMIAGELYPASDPKLVAADLHQRCVAPGSVTVGNAARW